MDITPEQRDHMMHAVGRLKVSDKPRARARKLTDCYRNYFCSDEDPSWEDLIVKGYATRRNGNAATGGSIVYYVTDAGFALLVQHRNALLADIATAKERLRRFA
jgi:hypothetical protein